MGAWSTTILGNDDALDSMAELGNLIGIREPHDWSADPAFTKSLLELTPVEQIITFIEGSSNLGIAAQSVAYMHMDVGAMFPQRLRNLAMQACDTENVDGWSDPGERRRRLTEFMTMIAQYDNKTPTRPETEGLWQKIFENMASSEPEAGSQKPSEVPLPGNILVRMYRRVVEALGRLLGKS